MLLFQWITLMPRINKWIVLRFCQYVSTHFYLHLICLISKSCKYAITKNTNTNRIALLFVYFYSSNSFYLGQDFDSVWLRIYIYSFLIHITQINRSIHFLFKKSHCFSNFVTWTLDLRINRLSFLHFHISVLFLLLILEYSFLKWIFHLRLAHSAYLTIWF